ncbi:MAG: hypothetical protein Kow00127_15420 [Bacteroidales bacterium]
MQTTLAKWISIILMPLLVPLYSLLIIYTLPLYGVLIIPQQYRLIILGMVFVSTFLFPVVMLLIMMRRGLVNSLHLDRRQERIIPLMITGFFFFLAYNMVRNMHLDEVFLKIFLGSFLSVMLALIISLFWKISMHMIGMGGLVGGLVGIALSTGIDLTGWIALSFLAAGLTGTARLLLQAHSPAQIYSGFAAGFFVLLILFVWL